MIYDRDYMQKEFERRELGPLGGLVVAIIAGFLLQSVAVTFVPSGEAFIRDHIALSLHAVKTGQVWTFLTHALVQPPPILGVGLLLAVGNAFAVYFLGRQIVPITGGRRFMVLSGAAILIGGLVTTFVAALRPTPGFVFGTTSILYALLTFFACLNPHRPVTFFLFLFVIPITVKPRTLLLALLGITTFFLVFTELTGTLWTVPPSSLLGGALAGWLYFRFVHAGGGVAAPAPAAIEMPAWMQRTHQGKRKAAVTTYTVNVTPPPEDLRAEVDRILDKINSEGFGALTDDERRILDNARDAINKH